MDEARTTVSDKKWSDDDNRMMQHILDEEEYRIRCWIHEEGDVYEALKRARERSRRKEEGAS